MKMFELRRAIVQLNYQTEFKIRLSSAHWAKEDENFEVYNP